MKKLKSFFGSIAHFTNKVTSNPWYNLIVSLSLVVVSVYDSWKVIIKDITEFSAKKEHWVMLIGFFMLIHAISNLIKGVKQTRSHLKEVEDDVPIKV